MARPGITRDQVRAAAERLKQRGESPTIMAVRRELGNTGSPNTIQPHLAEWLAEQHTAQRAPVPEPPAALGQLVHSVWETAWRAAQGELQLEREALAQARQDLERERQEMGSEIERLETALDQVEARLQAATAELANERQARHGFELQLEEHKALARERAERLAEKTAAYERSQQALEQIERQASEVRLDNARLTERVDTGQRRIEELQAQLDKLQERLATLAERAPRR